MFSDNGFSASRKRVLIINNDSDKKLAELLWLFQFSKNFDITQYNDLPTSRSYPGKSVPHIAVIVSPGLNKKVFEDIKKLNRYTPAPKVLFVHLGPPANIKKEMALELFHYGVKGFIIPGQDLKRVLSAIEKIADGERTIDDMILGWLLDSIIINESSDLTQRELEVLNLLCAGKTSTEMAHRLGISRLTVRSHIRNIYAKLHVSKKSDAIEVARKERYVQ